MRTGRTPWGSSLVVILAMTGTGPAAVAAQRTSEHPQPAPEAESDSLPRPDILLAIGETLLINVVVNRFDAWVLQDETERVTPEDWARNLRLGWVWDEDTFLTNMFAHPYHGSLYFNAGRSNGLSFWGSIPLVILGSWTWEYLGETNRPSLNDFFMTTFGGVSLGESFHRLGATVRDNEATGARRTWLEIAALPLDPIGGFNRLLRGEWSRVGPNPPEDGTGDLTTWVRIGARAIADSGFVESEEDTQSVTPTVQVDLRYGDPFLTQYEAPFDVFSFRAQYSPGGGDLNKVRSSGRLYAIMLSPDSARHRHGLSVNQRFDYYHNPAQFFGAQSIEVGALSRWRLSGASSIRTELFGSATVLGGLDAPFAGVGDRTYDFGPGGGLRFEIAYERNRLSYIALRARSEYLHTVSGASADHNVSLGGLELSVPISGGIGIAAQASYFRRTSRYSDQPDDSRDFGQLSLFAEWKSSPRDGGGR